MIELQNISKTFESADGAVEALRDVSLTIRDGDIYGVIGMSGAGKSTLVRCINLLERPSSGTVLIDGRDIAALRETELRKVRELLSLVGLSDKADAYPAQLSGGQKQRIAIARALATDPKVLLCDEATSALDPKTTQDILSLLKQLHETLHLTVILITHQMSVVEQICTRVAILDGGAVVEEGTVESVFSAPKSAAARRLVFADGYAHVSSPTDGRRCIRIVFRGTGTATAPLIARMAIEQGVLANILAASIKTISGREYGSMIVEVEDADALARALRYLKQNPDIAVEEVNGHDEPVL